MSKKKEDRWMVTLDDAFYYVGFHMGGARKGWEFTMAIETAYQFPTEQAAKATLEALVSGGDFKDSRGCKTPVTAFAVRKMTRKDYAAIRKAEKTHKFFSAD